ncbi:MAG: hypothetical protein L0Z48_08665, partial [candidate division Zixibacteria bacterium]|nr:hypothetical protein [candidate division Zixibacteria bacterium]
VGAGDVAVADFNPGFLCIGGCYSDIAATAPTTTPNGLMGVYFGDGNGNFSPVSAISTGGANPTYITAHIRFFLFFGAAVPAPAHLAISNVGSDNIGIIKSNGDQTFQAAVPVGSGLDNGVAWVDFNGDGFLDIAAPKSTTGVRTYPGLDNTFTNYGAAVDLISSAQHYADITNGDFTGDGLVDLAAVSDASLPGNRGLVTFFLNDGSGGFQAGMNDTTALPHSSCEAVDINGNVFPDLLVGTQSSNRDSAAIYHLRAPLLNPDLSSLGNPPAGQVFNLNGTATDSSLVSSITFLYRQMGKTTFDTLPPLPLGAGTKQRSFSISLPRAAMTNRGLEYAIIASDGFITERRPFGTGFYRMRTSVNETAPPTASGAYQLISFPFAVNPGSAASQIADNITGLGDPNVARLFWWDPVYADTVTTDTTVRRGYRELGSAGFPDFIPGRSMFLGTTSSRTYNGTGLSTLADTLGPAFDYARLPIDFGWNLVATPYGYPVDFDSISVLLADSGVYPCPFDDSCNSVWGLAGFDRTVREYVGTGYLAKRTLNPWKGYYVYSRHVGRIHLIFPKQEMVIPNPNLRPGLEHEIDWPTQWKIAITARSGDLITPPNILGAAPNASPGKDGLDLAVPPAMPGDFHMTFQRGESFGAPGNYLSDIRPASTETETWGFTVSPGSARAVELAFGGLADIPEEFDAILTDVEGRAKQNLRLEPVYRFIASEDRHFELTVTPKTTGEAALVPTKYELYQNLPNPFNPQTLIKYDLPQAASVRLEVFNILGQKVATLVDRYEAAGPKSALWDGTDAKGGKVSSGIYLYKISAG